MLEIVQLQIIPAKNVQESYKKVQKVFTKALKCVRCGLTFHMILGP